MDIKIGDRIFDTYLEKEGTVVKVWIGACDVLYDVRRSEIPQSVNFEKIQILENK